MTQFLEINIWFFFNSSIMKCLFTLFAFFNSRSQLVHPHRFTLGIFSNESEALSFPYHLNIKRIFIFQFTCKCKNTIYAIELIYEPQSFSLQTTNNNKWSLSLPVRQQELLHEVTLGFASLWIPLKNILIFIPMKITLLN